MECRVLASALSELSRYPGECAGADRRWLSDQRAPTGDTEERVPAAAPSGDKLSLGVVAFSCSLSIMCKSRRESMSRMFALSRSMASRKRFRIGAVCAISNLERGPLTGRRRPACPSSPGSLNPPGPPPCCEACAEGTIASCRSCSPGRCVALWRYAPVDRCLRFCCTRCKLRLDCRIISFVASSFLASCTV